MEWLVVTKRKCQDQWPIFEQGMPENFRHSWISGNNLEDRIQGVLRGIDVETDIGNIELCHRLKENRNKRKFIVNISKRKDAGKIKGGP